MPRRGVVGSAVVVLITRLNRLLPVRLLSYIGHRPAERAFVATCNHANLLRSAMNMSVDVR